MASRSARLPLDLNGLGSIRAASRFLGGGVPSSNNGSAATMIKEAEPGPNCTAWGKNSKNTSVIGTKKQL